MTQSPARVFRALRSRNYRLFFVGQGVSLIGTWLTRFAMYYETYELSGSALQLGLVAFFSQAPTAVIAPVAGVLVDRWNRHKTLVVTQAAAMLQSAALAAFALTGTLTVWHLLVLGCVQAVINAFDMPARQSFVRQMVDRKEDVGNAIALNSSLVNIARIVGPVVAAGLADVVGIGWCFALDSASYLAVIGSLLAMRVPVPPAKREPKRVRDELVDGLRYASGTPLVRDLLLLFLVTGTFGGAYVAMLPAIAKDSLHGGPHALGALMGAAGVGALVGALYLASREGVAGLVGVIAKCGVALGIGMAALELTTATWQAMPMMFVIGGALIVQWAATNTIAQSVVDDDKLGRVISLYALVYFAGAPIGALVEGALATWIGPIHTFAIAGAACVACSLVFRRSISSTR
jgi:MFS family permease